MTTIDAELRRKNREAVETFIDTNKRDRYLDQWADDGVKELPFAVLEETRWAGIAEVRRNSEENAVRRSGGDATRLDLRIFESADPNVFWVTNRCSEEKTFNGAPYPQRYVHQLVLRDGKVTLYREFFSSLVLERALLRQAPPALPAWTPVAYDPPREFDEAAAAASAESARVVEAWLAADLADPKSRDELWAEDALFEFPFAPPNQAKAAWRGRDELRARAEWFAENFTGCAHVDVELFPSVDPGLVWARSRMADTATAFGRPYPQTYLTAFNVRDGRVQLAQVYHDPLLVATVLPLAG
jgi:ketosteroid isomerase-like protein